MVTAGDHREQKERGNCALESKEVKEGRWRRAGESEKIEKGAQAKTSSHCHTTIMANKKEADGGRNGHETSVDMQRRWKGD